MKHKYQKGDEVTINAIVINVSESGNPIVRLKNGMRLLVKDSSEVLRSNTSFIYQKAVEKLLKEQPNDKN